MTENVKPASQALTLRLPENEYQLLRTLAFATGQSINEVVRSAIKRHLDQGDARAALESIIAEAESLRPQREIPRNPHGRGPKRHV